MFLTLFCGEDEIRTRGTLIRYVGLANRWFQPLTHLSVHPTVFVIWVCKYRIFLPKYKISAEKFLSLLPSRRIAASETMRHLILSLALLAALVAPATAQEQLSALLPTLEERFSVRIECRRFSPDTLYLRHAESRIRPYSVEATLEEVCRPLDLKFSRRGEGKYRLEPYEYYRRTPHEGEALLAWLTEHYAADLDSWLLRRDSLLRDVRRRLDMEPLYDSLVSEPRVVLGERCRFDGYTTQNYLLETLPGIFVGGTLYAPAQKGGKHPLVVSLAGHWPGGRLRPDQQYREATLARMGAVVVNLDIVGWGATASLIPFPHEDARSMRLQALWSKAVTDWVVASRRDIDTSRMAATGGSGGATHTLLLALQDSRFRLLVPVVHLVSHFDGGCLCESGVEVARAAGGSCMTEILAAVMAPNPLLVVSDGGDWTATYPSLEYPYLRHIWSLYGAASQVENCHLEGERHDYGPSKREELYRFLARELGLDLTRADESRVTIRSEELLEMEAELEELTH